jgi:uncharacterized protein
VAATVISLLMTAVTMAADRRHVHWPVALRLSASAALGMPLGLIVLARTPSTALAGLIAVVVTCCAVVVGRGWRLESSLLLVGAVGMLSGVLLTATGTNGPPLVAAIRALGLEPRAFRATIAAAFTFSGVIGVAVFVYGGEVSGGTLALCGTGGAAAVAGGWVGNRVFGSVDPDGFKRVVLVLLLVSAMVALARAGSALL